MKSLQCLACAAVVVALLAGAAGAPPADSEKRVEITDEGFKPDRMEIKAGDKVIWTNTSLKAHSVTSDEKNADDQKAVFDSGPMKPGGAYDHAFDKPGTYGYHCSQDKTFKGTIVVK